jgi:hypothetical protein
MRKLIFSSIIIFTIAFNTIGQELAPYIKIGESSETIQQVAKQCCASFKRQFVYSFREL